eukprot:6461003-Amphidinium_carterae.1
MARTRPANKAFGQLVVLGMALRCCNMVFVTRTTHGIADCTRRATCTRPHFITAAALSSDGTDAPPSGASSFDKLSRAQPDVDFVELVSSKLPDEPGDAVLELGFGAGQEVLELRKRKPELRI